MASESELAENSWYVSREVEIQSIARRSIAIPARIEGSDGVSLNVSRPVEFDLVGEPRTVAVDAVLTVPGLIRVKLPVELDVSALGPQEVEIGIRPSSFPLRFSTGLDRYFDAAWTAVDALIKYIEVNTSVEAGAAA